MCVSVSVCLKFVYLFLVFFSHLFGGLQTLFYTPDIENAVLRIICMYIYKASVTDLDAAAVVVVVGCNRFYFCSVVLKLIG